MNRFLVIGLILLLAGCASKAEAPQPYATAPEAPPPAPIAPMAATPGPQPAEPYEGYVEPRQGERHAYRHHPVRHYRHHPVRHYRHVHHAVRAEHAPLQQ